MANIVDMADRQARIEAAWRAGRTQADIGREFHITDKRVSQLLRRSTTISAAELDMRRGLNAGRYHLSHLHRAEVVAKRLATRRRNAWPPDKLNLLIEKHGEGASFSVIAAEVGCTRNKVAGMVFRLRNEGRLS